MPATPENATLLIPDHDRADSPTAVLSFPVLAEVATGLWRLRRKLLDPQTGAPHEELRGLWRPLEAVWEALTHAGLCSDDPVGMDFDSGLPLQALAFQPTPEATREIVLETIKPSLYWQGQRLQMGEVIVGTPLNNSSSPEPARKPNHDTHDH